MLNYFNGNIAPKCQVFRKHEGFCNSIFFPHLCKVIYLEKQELNFCDIIMPAHTLHIYVYITNKIITLIMKVMQKLYML